MQREVYTVLARSSFVHTFFSLTLILIRIPAFGVASSGRKERNRKFLFKYLPTRIRGSVVFFLLLVVALYRLPSYAVDLTGPLCV